MASKSLAKPTATREDHENCHRHMKKRGAEVLPDPRFDITTTLCKIRDLYSRH